MKDFREAAEKYATDIFKATQTTQTHWTDRIGAFIDGADHGYNEGYSEAKKEAREWIPVSERLPEINQYVVVRTSNHMTEIMSFHAPADTAKRHFHIFRFGKWMNQSHLVTHWFPLPIKLPPCLSSFTDQEQKEL